MGPQRQSQFFKCLDLLLPVCLAGLFLSGCSIFQLKSQDKKIAASGVIAVGAEGFEAPIYAVLLDSKGNALDYTSLRKDEFAAFVISSRQNARCLVFTDVNKNRRHDPGEPLGVSATLLAMPLEDTFVRKSLPTIRPDTADAKHFSGLALPKTNGTALKVALGEIASIEEKRFAPETGEEGMWSPHSALLAGDLGLYFCEPYDPTRIPVVFVHGIGGSPRDFATILKGLDRSKYQAWFFRYPSGFRLGKAGGTLSTMLDLTMQRTGTQKIHVVAHSMGGLVAREAILDLSAKRNGAPVGKFISISTPWGGHQAAEKGVRSLRYPVPSWIDLVPGSPFLTKLWKRPLPQQTKHFLIYGFATKVLPWLTLNNDSVVDVESSTFLPAQAEAVRVFALPYDHTGILTRKETIQHINSYLEAK